VLGSEQGGKSVELEERQSRSAQEQQEERRTNKWLEFGVPLLLGRFNKVDRIRQIKAGCDEQLHGFIVKSDG
jgi:hypothetical protein